MTKSDLRNQKAIAEKMNLANIAYGTGIAFVTVSDSVRSFMHDVCDRTNAVCNNGHDFTVAVNNDLDCYNDDVSIYIEYADGTKFHRIGAEITGTFKQSHVVNAVYSDGYKLIVYNNLCYLVDNYYDGWSESYSEFEDMWMTSKANMTKREYAEKIRAERIAEHDAMKADQENSEEHVIAELPAKKARKNPSAKAVMILTWKLYHECTGEHAAKLRYAARRAWAVYKTSGVNGIKEELEKIEHYKRCVEIAECVDRFDTYAVDSTERIMQFTIDGTPYELDCKKYDAHEVLTTALKDAGFTHLKTSYGVTYYQKKSDLVNGWNVEKLTAEGAKRWTKGDHDRVYVSCENCSLEFEYYKSGNVCAAYFNGDHISNSMGCRIGAYISRSMYIDLKTGKIVFVHSSKHSYPEEVAEILKRKYYEGSENNA